MKRLPKYLISRLVTLSLVLSVSQCGQLDRETLLSGDFGTIDKTPPTLIAPANGEKITKLQATLVWSKNISATQYTIQIARDTEFTEPMAGSPFKTEKTSLTVTFEDAYTYYWRVRANTTEEGRYSQVQTVHAFDEDLFVYCPESTVTCTNTDKTGNKSNPYEIVNDAVIQAENLGLGVKIAARGNGEPYQEIVKLAKGVSLRGGFNSSNWQQDISNNETIIENNQADLIYGNSIASNENFLIQGLTLINTSTIWPKHILRLNNSESVITIDKVIFKTENSADICRSIETNASKLILKNSILHPCNGGQANGVYLSSQSELTAFNNVIHSGPGTSSAQGVFASASTLNLYNNTIYGRSDCIVVRDGSNLTLKNNLLKGATCLNVFNTSTLNSIENNLFSQCVIAIKVGSDNYENICSNGKPSLTACGSGVDLATITGGNFKMTEADLESHVLTDMKGPDTLFNTMPDNDWSLKPASSQNCNIVFGGLNLTQEYNEFSVLVQDIVNTTRTNQLSGIPCTLTSPASTSGQGWSIGAFEQDE